MTENEKNGTEVKKVRWLNFAFLCEMQTYMLPVTLFFYLENGLTVGDYVFFQALSAILYVVLGVPAGYAADHFSKKYILLTGFCFNISRLVLWIFCGGYWIVFGGEVLAVMTRLFTTGMSDSYLYEYLHEKKQTGKILALCGKVNSFMSAGMAVASLLGPLLYPVTGLSFLLCLELGMTLLGTFFLLLLPRTKIYNRHNYSLKDIKRAFVDLFHSLYLKNLLLYNIILFTTTTVFLSTFQPLMKNAAVPVVLFGFVYFFNHTVRGVFSRLADKMAHLFVLPNLLKTAAGMITLAMLFMAAAFILQKAFWAGAALVFVCFSIGMQLTNQTIAIAELHYRVDTKIRATSIAVFNMLCRGIAGIVLIGFKQIAVKESFVTGYLCFCLVFVVCAAVCQKKFQKVYKENM